MYTSKTKCREGCLGQPFPLLFFINPNGFMTSSSAVYFQRSRVVQEEFALIEIATERETLVNKLNEVIRDVKEERKELDDDMILETFKLFNVVRDATIRTIQAIVKWQESFTKLVRPTIFQVDFMIEKLVKEIDFVNSSKIRKVFNFQFYRGNVLLLPYPNLSGGEPVRVTPQIAREIKYFSHPVEETLIASYQVLIDSLPESIYKEKVTSLEKWLIEPWVPKIWIANSPVKPLRPASGNALLSQSHRLRAKEVGEMVTSSMKEDKGRRQLQSDRQQRLSGRFSVNSSGKTVATTTTAPSSSSLPIKSASRKSLSSTMPSTPLLPSTPSNSTRRAFISANTPKPEEDNNKNSSQMKRRQVLSTVSAQQILSLTTLDEEALLLQEREAARLAAAKSEQQGLQTNQIFAVEDETARELRELESYCLHLQETLLPSSRSNSRRQPRSNDNNEISLPTVSPVRPASPSKLTFAHVVKVPKSDIDDDDHLELPDDITSLGSSKKSVQEMSKRNQSATSNTSKRKPSITEKMKKQQTGGNEEDEEEEAQEEEEDIDIDDLLSKKQGVSDAGSRPVSSGSRRMSTKNGLKNVTQVEPNITTTGRRKNNRIHTSMISNASQKSISQQSNNSNNSSKKTVTATSLSGSRSIRTPPRISSPDGEEDLLLPPLQSSPSPSTSSRRVSTMELLGLEKQPKKREHITMNTTIMRRLYAKTLPALDQ